MKILIVGASATGLEVARMLVKEKHEIVVIGTSEEELQPFREYLDVEIIEGNGTSGKTLKEAGLATASYLLALSNSDETNIIACMMAKRLEERIQTVACLHDDSMRSENLHATSINWGIDFIANPDESTANQIFRLIRRAGGTDMMAFADGQIQLVGMRLTHDTWVNKTVRELVVANSKVVFRLVAIQRNIQTIIPQADTILKKNDHLFVLTRSEDVPSVLKLSGGADRPIQDIMILGSTDVAMRVGRGLKAQPKEKAKSIKLIEKYRSKAEEIADELAHVLVINGDMSDIDLLVSEGLDDMDVLIAATDDPELNLVTCLLGEHYKVRKTIARVSKTSYIPIAHDLGLDSVVNQDYAVALDIMNFIRWRGKNSATAIPDLEAEVLELQAGHRASITKSPLRALILPRGMVIGYVMHGDQVEIATAETQIREGDHVVLFVLPHLVDEARYYFEGLR